MKTACIVFLLSGKLILKKKIKHKTIRKHNIFVFQKTVAIFNVYFVHTTFCVNLYKSAETWLIIDKILTIDLLIQK